MGRPDRLDRLAQALIGLVALLSLGNGAVMLARPEDWYWALPNLRFTGPPNAHFIRDIGAAYLCSAVLLAYAAVNPAGRWLAALAGSLWLIAHAGIHIYERAVGICDSARFWADAPGTIAIPLLVWVALAILALRRRIAPAGLPPALIIREIEGDAPGEAAYLRELAAAPGHAFEKMAHFLPLTTHRWQAPAGLFHMARIGALLVEDCGPCALTAARGALRDGVPPQEVNAALAGRPPGEALQLAFDFGQAIARQSAAAAELGAAIEARYGRGVRLELALTAATIRAFPALKRGLGLDQACALTPMRV